MTSIQAKTATAPTQAAITGDNLYQPDKYKVILGQGTVGFCTVWNEAKAAVTLAPQLHEKAAIIGTLYSSQGVNYILRNLALNPFIRELYLWGHGTLSNTKFGVVGSGVLKKIWQEGVQADGSVPGTSFKLEKEIDASVIDTIRSKVELIDVSDQELQGAVSVIKAVPSEPYMDSLRFPDAVLEVPDTFPSEEAGFVIHGRGVIDTWTRVVERIMRYGTTKGTQYGSRQKELIGVTWVIHEEDPKTPKLPTDWPRELQEVVGATEDAITEYHQVFLSPEKPSGLHYTYGNRLMRYPNPAAKEGEAPYVDQIKDSIIRNLKDSPDSRRAVATTFVPWIDAYSAEPPCIMQVQCIHTNGKLHFLITVRSHDIFKAAVPNAFGLRTLQATIATELGFELGVLQITSQSAHFYESDWDNARKLAACAFWERPVNKMYDASAADPRGVFLIRVSDGKIKVDFNTLGGQPLLQFEGKSADLLALKIAQNELISQSGHALDIGIQLARAEIALKKGIEFTQDRPLVL
jgi:thymidylate synthase